VARRSVTTCSCISFISLSAIRLHCTHQDTYVLTSHM
jgi:hypothetical protein